MKLLRYGPAGHEKPGCLDVEGRVRDLSGHVDDIAGAALLPDAIAALKALDVSSLPIVEGTPQSDLRLGSCVGQTGKFVCIGLNYASHAAEAGMEQPSEPVVFFKATTAWTGPNDPIVIPRNSEKTDWEVELAVVIGKKAKYVSEGDALDYIAGYAVHNDYSEREWQLEKGGQWVKGKSADSYAPFGPYLVTPDEVGDYDNLAMWLEVDGTRHQNGSTKTMVYKVPHLVSYCSQFMSLQPGDIISTGTPPGVGMGLKPQTYLSGGETMRLGIDKLGVQTQVVRPAK